jgi:hypothetical protein
MGQGEHLVSALEIIFRIGPAEFCRIVEGNPVLDADKDILEPVIFPHDVVNIIGCDRTKSEPTRQLDELSAKFRIFGMEMVLQLDVEMVGAKQGRIFLRCLKGFILFSLEQQ